MFQTYPRGFIPVSVQAERRDGADLRRIGGDRILEPALVEADLFFRQTEPTQQEFPDFG